MDLLLSTVDSNNTYCQFIVQFSAQSNLCRVILSFLNPKLTSLLCSAKKASSVGIINVKKLWPLSMDARPAISNMVTLVCKWPCKPGPPVLSSSLKRCIERGKHQTYEPLRSTGRLVKMNDVSYCKPIRDIVRMVV